MYRFIIRCFEYRNGLPGGRCSANGYAPMTATDNNVIAFPSSRVPWMPLWPDDPRWRGSNVARTAYVEVAGLQWTDGSIPGDPGDIRKRLNRDTDAEWVRAWRRIKREFSLCPDGRRRSEHLRQSYDMSVEIERLRFENDDLRARLGE